MGHYLVVTIGASIEFTLITQVEYSILMYVYVGSQ